MTPTVVWAKAVSGWNMSIAQLFGSGPKLNVTCGGCGGGFSARVAMINYPVVRCPCGQANKLNITVT